MWKMSMRVYEIAGERTNGCAGGVWIRGIASTDQIRSSQYSEHDDHIVVIVLKIISWVV